MTLFLCPWQTSFWLSRTHTSLKSGIKPNNLAALRTATLQIATLIPDNVLKITEEDSASFEIKGHARSSHKKGHDHSCERQEKCQDNSKLDKLA